MGGGSLGQVERSELLGGSADGAVGQGELDLVVVEADGGGSLAVLGRDGGGADDLDRGEAGSVTASHVVV